MREFLIYVIGGALALFAGYLVYTQLTVLTQALKRQEHINAASSNMIGAMAAKINELMAEQHKMPPVRDAGLGSANKGDIVITVRKLTGDQLKLLVSPAATVDDLKHQIEHQWEIPAENQRLIYAGKQMDSGELSSYNIINDSNIHLVVRLPSVGAVNTEVSAEARPLSPELKAVAVASAAQPLTEQQQTAGTEQVVVDIPPVVSDRVAVTVPSEEDSSSSDESSDEESSSSDEDPAGVEPVIGVSTLMATVTENEHHQSVVGLTETREHVGDTRISKNDHCPAIIGRGPKVGQVCGKKTNKSGYCVGHQSMARPSMVMNRDTEI